MIYTETFQKILSLRQWKPDWLSVGQSKILPIMINKFSKPFLNKENNIFLNFTKKNLNYINNINGNNICIAIVSNINEQRCLKNIWNKNNEMFDYIFMVDKFIEWLENNDMNFDKIIMNPPYGSLHIKILDAILKSNKKNDGWEIVNLSPIEWQTRPYIKKSWMSLYEKEKSTIGKFQVSLDHLSYKEFNEAFPDTQNDIEVGISVYNQNGGFDYENYYKKYDEKLLKAYSRFKNFDTLKNHYEKYNNQEYFVPLRKDAIMERWWRYQLINYLDILDHGKVYSGEYKNKTIIEARSSNPHENKKNVNRDTFGISFKTLNEAINFRDCVKDIAYIFIISEVKMNRGFPLDLLPFFGDYSLKWSTERIINECKISKVEVESFSKLKKYMNYDKNEKYV